jgi:hypothetical protein
MYHYRNEPPQAPRDFPVNSGADAHCFTHCTLYKHARSADPMPNRRHAWYQRITRGASWELPVAGAPHSSSWCTPATGHDVTVDCAMAGLSWLRLLTSRPHKLISWRPLAAPGAPRRLPSPWQHCTPRSGTAQSQQRRRCPGPVCSKTHQDTNISKCGDCGHTVAR